VNNDIFTGALAMLSMIGKSTSVLVLSDAIGLYAFYAYLGGLDQVPFVNHCRTKIGSVECLDWKIPLSILCRNMKVTNTFGEGIRVDHSRHQLYRTWSGSGEFSITM